MLDQHATMTSLLRYPQHARGTAEDYRDTANHLARLHDGTWDAEHERRQAGLMCIIAELKHQLETEGLYIPPSRPVATVGATAATPPPSSPPPRKHPTLLDLARVQALKKETAAAALSIATALRPPPGVSRKTPATSGACL